jgi:signal transduction histidine kinase
MTALADAARAFGDGDLGQRVSVRGGVGEVEVAADAFDDMAARIEEMVLRLRELDELKSHFVASVSHELRTPLTSVSGFVGVLLEPGGEPLSDGQREMLAIVKRNAGYLEALIDDLLLLARLESGQMTLELRDVDVAELLEELCAELQPAVHERAIALDVEADGRPVVAADRARLRQTFVNLVGNAIKFSPPAGRVAVRALSEGEEAVVEICDEGPGIPEDELPRLCERFFRASTAVGVKGTGLGLTISREIVELHGGRLEVRSTLGEGSTFRVHLPAVAR